jgi:pyridoxamine 5'-phosphate oxidase
MNISLPDLRQNYHSGGLLETEAEANPFKQFEIWLKQALAAELIEPNAMTLATVNREGKPTARMVLLKGFNENGFVFFTNYDSHKGNHLKENPWAALVFWWGELERQVRIEGKVEKVSQQESDLYFQNRPNGSQLGAYVSPQSQVIESREILDLRLRDFQQKFKDRVIPRPSHWGGFRVIPSQIEFWQGRTNRLHDRLRYRLLNDGTWLRERLAP